MKKIVVLVAAGVFLLAALAGYAALDFYRYMHSPSHEKSGEPVVLTISPGDSFDTILEKLVQSDLVEHPVKFEIMTRLMGYERSIKAGRYRLYKQTPPLHLLWTIETGAVALSKVTIPEGFNIRQIAQRLDEKEIAESGAFREAAFNPRLAEEMNIPADNVEGYLFPETYFFADTATPQKIIKTMIDEFRKHFPAKWEKRAADLGFTLHEIVTLASIIEKETAVHGERTLISSVLHNRLEKNMRLEADPTVIYGIENFDGNLTRSDLNTHTPYNTYIIKGLPPGPIANPGMASLHAALYPADTDYLYFVAKPDSTHYFSETFKEHSRAVRKYQLSADSP